MPSRLPSSPNQSPLATVLHDERRLNALARLDSTLLHTAEFTDALSLETADARNRRTYGRLAALIRAQGGAAALTSDRERLATTLEWAAVVDPAVFHTALVHLCACLTTIQQLGHPSPYLDGLTAELEHMHAIGLVLITESGRSGSHLDPGTEAVFQPSSNSFTLHTRTAGAAKIMAHAAAPGTPKAGIVYAQLLVGGQRCGVFPFALRLRTATGVTPGVRIRALPEVPALPLDYAEVTFDGAVVPYGGWLRDSAGLTSDGHFTDPLKPRSRRLVRSLVFSASTSAGAAMGQAAAARAAVATTLRHAMRRMTTGQLAPGRCVLDYRTQQEALYGALAEAWGTSLMVNKAMSTPLSAPAGTDSGAQGPTWAPWTSVHRDMALIKAGATDALARITSVCRTRSGAQGTISANRLTEYEGLAQVFQAAAGDNLLIRLDTGKSFVEDGRPARTAPVPLPSKCDFSDPVSTLTLISAHEAGLLNRLRSALASANCNAPELEVWNPLLPDAVRLADTHIQALSLEAFNEAVGSLTSQATLHITEALSALRTLYALNSIENSLSWHLQHGTLTPSDMNELPAARTTALRCIHRHLPLLTDATAVPPARLRSPWGSLPQTADPMIKESPEGVESA